MISAIYITSDKPAQFFRNIEHTTEGELVYEIRCLQLKYCKDRKDQVHHMISEQKVKGITRKVIKTFSKSEYGFLGVIGYKSNSIPYENQDTSASNKAKGSV